MMLKPLVCRIAALSAGAALLCGTVAPVAADEYWSGPGECKAFCDVRPDGANSNSSGFESLGEALGTAIFKGLGYGLKKLRSRGKRRRARRAAQDLRIRLKRKRLARLEAELKRLDEHEARENEKFRRMYAKYKKEWAEARLAGRIRDELSDMRKATEVYEESRRDEIEAKINKIKGAWRERVIFERRHPKLAKKNRKKLDACRPPAPHTPTRPELPPDPASETSYYVAAPIELRGMKHELKKIIKARNRYYGLEIENLDRWRESELCRNRILVKAEVLSRLERGAGTKAEMNEALNKKILGMGTPFPLRKRPKHPGPGASSDETDRYAAELNEHLIAKKLYENRLKQLADEARALADKEWDKKAEGKETAFPLRKKPKQPGSGASPAGVDKHVDELEAYEKAEKLYKEQLRREAGEEVKKDETIAGPQNCSVCRGNRDNWYRYCKTKDTGTGRLVCDNRARRDYAKCKESCTAEPTPPVRP